MNISNYLGFTIRGEQIFHKSRSHFKILC